MKNMKRLGLLSLAVLFLMSCKTLDAIACQTPDEFCKDWQENPGVADLTGFVIISVFIIVAVLIGALFLGLFSRDSKVFDKRAIAEAQHIFDSNPKYYCTKQYISVIVDGKTWDVPVGKLSGAIETWHSL